MTLFPRMKFDLLRIDSNVVFLCFACNNFKLITCTLNFRFRTSGEIYKAESKMAENLGEENVFNENIKFSFGEVKGGALDEDEDDDEVCSLYSACFPVCW